MGKTVCRDQESKKIYAKNQTQRYVKKVSSLIFTHKGETYSIPKSRLNNPRVQHLLSKTKGLRIIADQKALTHYTKPRKARPKRTRPKRAGEKYKHLRIRRKRRTSVKRSDAFDYKAERDSSLTRRESDLEIRGKRYPTSRQARYLGYM